jgi:hypothetical protein
LYIYDFFSQAWRIVIKYMQKHTLPNNTAMIPY